MSKTTTRWGHPYPELTDTADGPRDFKALAESLDNVAMDDQGALSSRPVSTVGSPGKKGRYYFATDNGVLYRDAGTEWVAVNRQSDTLWVPGEVTRAAATFGSFSTPIKVTLPRVKANQAIEIIAFGWGKGSAESRQSPETKGAYYAITLDGTVITPENRLASEKHDIAANSYRQVGTFHPGLQTFHPASFAEDPTNYYEIGTFGATIGLPSFGSVKPWVHPFQFVVSAERTNAVVELVGKMLPSGTVSLTNTMLIARIAG